MIAAAQSAGSSAGNLVLNLALWSLIIAAYWVPTVVALARKVPSRGSVAVVNGFLGWTVVGWVVALAMACRSAPKPAQPYGY